MEVKYTAKSLEEIAKYWDEAAKDAHERADAPRASRLAVACATTEAHAYERFAQMLRNTTLEK